MENLSEILYGKDYSVKLKKFNNAVDHINSQYGGEFNTTAYFTMLTNNQKREVKLSFDQDKDIPNELKEKVLKVFKEIWQ